jgi:hypothetical protein
LFYGKFVESHPEKKSQKIRGCARLSRALATRWAFFADPGIKQALHPAKGSSAKRPLETPFLFGMNEREVKSYPKGV